LAQTQQWLIHGVCAPHERRPLFASYSKSLKMQIKF